jgi:outer membrane receptor protein involved in Fe transport
VQFRSSDYDTFGEETVYRGGLNWQINDWVRVRGTISTAYRAPQVTDLFSGGVVSFDFFTHPCADASRQPGNNVDQNCLLDGVPAGVVQNDGQFAILAGGNPALEPETADTFSYGVVFTPHWIFEGVSISIDVWDIEVDDLITRPESDSIVDACYNGAIGLTDPNCARFDTGVLPNNSVVVRNMTNQLINENKVETNGFDFGVHYEFDIADLLFNLDLQGTYVDENTFYPGAGGADDRGSIPRIKANFVGNVDWNNFDFTWRTRYIHGMSDPRFDGNNAFGYEDVPSHTEHDIRVGWNLENYRIVFGVNDLFDRDPPYLFSTGNNTDLFLYDAMGRYFFLRATLSM